jgi:hypothetical protein
VRAQERPLAEVQGVVQLHRGVVGGEIERPEVVPLRLGLGAERDGETQLAEDGADLVDHEGDGMEGAGPVVARGEGAVPRGVRGAGDLSRGEVGEGGIEGALQLVEQLARAPLVERGGHGGHLALEAGEALVLEGVQRTLDRVQPLRGVGMVQERQALLLEGFGERGEFGQFHGT